LILVRLPALKVALAFGESRNTVPPDRSVGLDSFTILQDNESGRTREMPRQEVFFEQSTGGRRVEVLKTYDQSYAREVFNDLDSEAREALATALDLKKNYEPADIPAPEGIEYDDFLWDELFEAAREDVRSDPNLYSFFVVAEDGDGKSEDLYISPDWPSAEAFAKKLIAANGSR